MKKLMVLDGNSIVNRAFYGVSQNLATRAGQPTNAIFGFLNILQKLLDEGKPDALCVTFDRKAPTFRHLAYEGYKAQRKGMPEELAAQMGVSRQAVSRWELNIALPDTENVVRLSELFGVTTDYLLKQQEAGEKPSPELGAPGSKGRYSAQQRGGGILMALSLLGLLVMGILSSIQPTVSYYPDGSVAADGLIAWVRAHDLMWLFGLCLLGALVSVYLLVKPRRKS